MAKYEKTERLEKVPMEYLWEGLVLSDNLYNYNGSVLLVPSGEVITKSKLDKLINFSDGNNYITTFRGSYEYIMKGKDRPAEIQQKMLENRTGYTELRKGIDHVLQMSKNAMFVNHAEVEGMMEKVYGRMVSVDAGEIFQCITVPRPVDEALQRHSLNVALLNGIMGQWLGLDEKDIRSLLEHTLSVVKFCDYMVGAYPILNKDLLFTAAICHDIGKTKIPEEILNAPRKLTPEEFEVMKRHPLYSFELLGDDISEDVRYAVRWHHEKLDGKGYPDGLKAESISYFARITTISDIYDAMLSARSYKKEKIPFDVLQWFVTEGSKGIDQNLLNIFIKNMVKVYRQQQVIMSDGREGCVEYIPLNDMDHPIVSVGEEVRQVDEDWYCVHMV